MNIIYSNWKEHAAVPQEKRKLNTKCYKTYRDLDDICPDCQAVNVLKTKEVFNKQLKTMFGQWVDLRILPILKTDGEVECFVEWLKDITEQKKTEELIVEKNKILYEINEFTKEQAGVLSYEKQIETINRQLKKYTGSDFIAFSEYNNDKKTLILKRIESDKAGALTGLKNWTSRLI